MTSRMIALDAYLHKTGVSREDLLADPNRPLISTIGATEYVDSEDALRFEAWVRSRALYARAGVTLPEPDLRPLHEQRDRPIIRNPFTPESAKAEVV